MGTLVLPPMDSQQHALPPPAFSMLPSSFAPAGLMRPYAQAPVAQVPSFQQIQQPPQPQQPQQQHAGRGRMQQQPQQQKGLGPRTSRGKKRKHRWHGKGRGDGAPPSLAALSAQNRRRAQQHFGNGERRGLVACVAKRLTGRSQEARWAEAFACVTNCADTPMSEAPRTAPHAPHNDNNFILSQHGRVSSGAFFRSARIPPFMCDCTPAVPPSSCSCRCIVTLCFEIAFERDPKARFDLTTERSTHHDRAGGRFESPAMAPSQPSNEVQWTPRHDGFPADYGSLGKDAADLGAQLDFFGAHSLLFSESLIHQFCCTLSPSTRIDKCQASKHFLPILAVTWWHATSALPRCHRVGQAAVAVASGHWQA